MTSKRKKELEALAALPDDQIDMSDIPRSQERGGRLARRFHAA
jgi:hypothetical protein